MTADNNTCHRIKKFCWRSNPKSPGLLFWVFYTLEEQSFQQVANRVSGGSFRGGRWRYLPFRHHDNRYSAVWIRRYPGLSKNSEDGNSCPKSHKAARFDWSCGKSGQQWDWDYKPKYGYHHDETHSFGSETWWFQRSEWTKRMSCALQLFAPKSQQLNLIFSGTPYRRLGQGRLDNHPVRAMEWESFPPSPDYGHYSPPPFNCLCKTLCTATCRAGLLTGAEINGTGPDGCLPELDMFPLLQVMCLWYMCLCAEVFFFSVLRLYSKWSIVWGLNFFFPPLSPHVKAVSF